MRQASVGGARMYYPEELSFAFNPEYIIVNDDVEVEVTLSANGKTFTDKREAIGGEMRMDISYYLQMLFNIDRRSVIAATSIEVDVTVAYNESSFSFSTSCVWGSISPWESLYPSRKEKWFKSRIRSQIIYFLNPPGNTSLYGSYDGGEVKKIASLNEKGGIAGIIPAIYFPNAEKEVTLYIGEINQIDSFDSTFDSTFHIEGVVPVLKIEIDNCESGIMLNWIDKRGLNHYYLFQQSSLSIQAEDNGDSIHVDFNDISAFPKSGDRFYNGVSRQMKNEQRTINLNVPLVDKETFEFLASILASPLVNASFGEGVSKYSVPVNVVSGTKTMSNAHLQDFELTIQLPESQIQKL